MTWIGVDILEVTRFQQACARHPRLVPRVFHADEVAYAEGPHYWQRLAARFAGKEAVVKACRGFRRSAWRDIVIRGRVNHPPEVTIVGPLGEWVAHQRGRVTVSLSHDRHVVSAVALLEVPDDLADLDRR